MTFSDLLQLASERLGVEIEDAGGAAGVEVDGMPVVLQDAGDLLLLRAELGAIPAEGRESVLAAAMEGNWLYQGTGGATLALDPAGGGLGLQKYTWLDRLDADAAFETLERFAATAAFWRKTVADFVASSAPAEDPATPSPAAGGLLV